MRVYLGSDHAGFELKTHLLEHLAAAGHETVDCGPTAYDPEDDYPPYCFATGERVIADPGSLGVVIGGSGNGEQIAANKVPGVRAALAWSEETARLAREHNDAHVVSIGARMHTPDEAAGLVDVFLATGFTGGERHARRLRLLADYEARTGRPPATPV
ncbi:MAG: ribose-5-phosphate isomerase [Mycobacteriales bacterium]